MTNEEKAAVLEELYAYLCGEPGEKAPEYIRMREAMQSAIYAIRTASKGEPLAYDRGSLGRAGEAIGIGTPAELVSVKDRMPNKGENVLVFATAKYSKGWKFAIDRLEEGEKEPIWLYTHGWFEITHWMPLPNPPSDLED